MKIVLIIYAISWLILLSIFIASQLKTKESVEKQEWYLYAFIIAFAPLVILILPYILVDDFIKDKKQKKSNAKWEAEKKAKEEKRLLALRNYHSAKNQNSVIYTEDYANIASTLFNIAQRKEYGKLSICLQHLTLMPGWELDVDLCKEIGSGDDSSLMVTKGDIQDLEIWNYINVKEQPIAAWEVFLLNSLWHVLPHFWHGGYNRRFYIFSDQDIPNINFIRSEHSAWLVPKIFQLSKELTSEIIKGDDTYYISCCYWSDWGGLIKELVEIKITNNKVTSIFNVDSTTLFEYKCGIMF